MFDSKPKTILVTPQSAVAGSRLGTINILIDEAIVDDIQYLETLMFQNNRITHNNSGDELHYRHDTPTRFRLVVNNTNPVSSFNNYFKFNSSSLSKLRDVPTAHCTHNQSTTHNLTKFLILSLDIILQSDSLYHLGEHTEGIHGYLSIPNTDLRYFYFGTTLNLKVQAGRYSSSNEQLSHLCVNFFLLILFADCDDKSQLYDFTTHKCVSQCPCGYAPFRKHHTAYCEPGIKCVLTLHDAQVIES